MDTALKSDPLSFRRERDKQEEVEHSKSNFNSEPNNKVLSSYSDRSRTHARPDFVLTLAVETEKTPLSQFYPPPTPFP
jgi:hypothetical protein